MPRIAYVNGRYLPHKDARVHIEDRGYQFADGVYEVLPVRGGVMIDVEDHMQRLSYSLGEIKLASPLSPTTILEICKTVIRKNLVTHGIVYLQVTRGVAPRNHAFPAIVRPSVVVTARETAPLAAKVLEEGIAVITRPEIRWARRDIKSVSLLPNILAKQEAVEAGAQEAWFVDESGFISEGTASNAWIVTYEGKVITHPRDRNILGGITRKMLLAFLAELGLELEERPFHLDEALKAREAFTTSSSSTLVPVTSINGQVLANGRAGELASRLRAAYSAHISQTII